MHIFLTLPPYPTPSRSATYSSTDPSEKATLLAFENNPRNSSQARRSFSAVPLGTNGATVSGRLHQSQDDHDKSSADRNGSSAGRGTGDGRLEDQDIPKSDWGRTLDTAISIPEGGAEERADQHEANASLEHAQEHGIMGDGFNEDRAGIFSTEAVLRAKIHGEDDLSGHH